MYHKSYRTHGSFAFRVVFVLFPFFFCTLLIPIAPSTLPERTAVLAQDAEFGEMIAPTRRKGKKQKQEATSSMMGVGTSTPEQDALAFFIENYSSSNATNTNMTSHGEKKHEASTLL